LSDNFIDTAGTGQRQRGVPPATARFGSMPLGRRVALLNKAGLNKLTVKIAPWMPGFGVVVHRGRRSGKRYRTPIDVFLRDGGYLVALTYGPDADWVKNVLAAGGCEIQTRRRLHRLTSPRLEHREKPEGLPPVVRMILRLAKVHDFLVLDPARATG